MDVNEAVRQALLNLEQCAKKLDDLNAYVAAANLQAAIDQFKTQFIEELRSSKSE